MVITVTINGKKKNIASTITILDLLTELKLTSEMVVVEVNENHIERNKFSNTKINHNDSIEILEFVGGG